MSLEALKQRVETITKGPPVYKDIIELSRNINQSLSKVKPSRSIFSFSNNKKNELKKIKNKLDTFTSKNMFSKHRGELLNTVRKANRVLSIRPGRGKTQKIKRSVLRKIRENRNPSRNASRSRASRSRAYR